MIKTYLSDAQICYFLSAPLVEQVRLSPNITSITVEKTSDLSVTCQATGAGSSSISYIKWFRINATGENEVDRGLVRRMGSNGQDKEVLELRNIVKTAEGTYKCQRKIKAGPATSIQFSLFVKGTLQTFGIMFFCCFYLQPQSVLKHLKVGFTI